MPVPKRKRSRARRDSRFANKGLKVKAITTCKQCNEPLSPHVACKGCGFYKGVKVIATKNERVVKRQEIRAKQKTQQAGSEPQAAQ
ncbi:50S ribosomal protein L32 [Candidatus Dependentiae bacterium]|nr:50S ribosomal protein L32 [Candidatus Dependentiae bacterium]